MRVLLIPVLFITTSLFGQVTDFDTQLFSKADSIANLYQDYPLNNPEHLAQELTKDLQTDAARFRAIFKWITNNIHYDVYIFQKKNKKERQLKYKRTRLLKWNTRLNKRLYKRLITKKVALCSGYANLLKQMCLSVGIECAVVEGYARNYNDRINHGRVDHAWNAVKLNTKWYLADVTWASGYVTDNETVFIQEFKSAYFLTDPSLLIANHYPRKETWTLLYTRPTIKQFLYAPIKTSAFIENKINYYSPEIGKLKVKRDSSLTFSFTTNAEYAPQKAIIEEITPKASESFTYDLIQNSKGELSFSHCFNKKGLKRVYIYIKNQLTFVYEVSVH